MLRLCIRIFKKMNRLIGLVVDRSCLYILLMHVCLTFVSGCEGGLPAREITHHGDSFVVMETHNRAGISSKRGMIKSCREFYRHYEDSFDLLVLVYNAEDEVMDAWEPNVKGNIAGVRHTETGTGRATFDIGRVFGSESKLKGVVQLANPKGIIEGFLLHEIMHLWVDRVEVIPSVIEEHWGFSSVGGLLGGFQADALVDLGDGRYSAGDFYPGYNWGTIPYSELEMYLAGWMPPNEVSKIWVAEDGEWLSRELTPEVLDECVIKDGPHTGKLDEDCIIQTDSNGNKIFTASKISTWTIEQIIEKLGPRAPNYEQSQKEFRVAFVAVSQRNSAVESSELEFMDLMIKEFSAQRPISRIGYRMKGSPEYTHLYNFWEATKGIATLEADDLQSFRR